MLRIFICVIKMLYLSELNSVKRGCPDLSEEENNNRHIKDFYFAFSKWTKEKEEIFANYF